MTARPVSGAEALVRVLEQLGVTHAFGLPGTQNLALFEALRASRLRTVVPTHELAAAFMAGAFHRACGRPAMLVSIAGPGFAYTLPGLAEARLDSAALIHVTNAPPHGPGSQFRLQELKQAAIAHPLVKGLVVVDRPQDMAAAAARAHAAALEGEPGPVMIKVAESAWGPLGEGPGRLPDGHTLAAPVPPADPDGVLTRLRAARRPVVLAGQGAQGDAAGLLALLERLGAPLVTTGSGRGVVAEDHPLAMGYDTQRGTSDALNALLERADLVLVVAAKLGHNGTAGFRLRLPPERTVHVDASPEVIGANYPVAAGAAMTTAAFLAAAAREDLGPAEWEPEELVSWKGRLSVPLAEGPEPRMGGVPPATFFRALRNALPRDAMLVTDSGTHQVLTRRHVPVLAQRGLLFPSDFQAMGFGVPAALAAKLAAPERTVVAVVGDGGMAMSGLELATAVREGADLVVVVCRDGYLGQIRLQQVAEYGRTHGVRLAEVGYAALAAAVGARYAALGPEVADTVRRAVEAGGVWLLEVPVGDSAAVTLHRLEGAARAVGRVVLRGRVRSLARRVWRLVRGRGR